MSASTHLVAAGRSDDRTAARALLQRHGRTFFLARHLLGPLHAERAARLYAFRLALAP